MIQKIKSKKGFTLAELLIVVAIIGVLVAIAIPVFSSQLDNAKTQVAAANERAAQSMATVSYVESEG
ncbi:MAG: prepilin-type N-terminal cleavage/methylation domain-containing protein, partial [Oscillospiraceae bacterium]